MLLRAYEPPASVHYSGDYVPDFEALRAGIERETQSYLEGKVAALNAQGLKRVFSMATEGPAGDEIIKYALGHPGSLVAMCTHGRSGVRRWVLGSVTEKVVRHSGGAVLVISASRGAKQTDFDRFGEEVSGAMRYTID
jgi:nucleotide-binding universal stress UspA family protein